MQHIPNIINNANSNINTDPAVFIKNHTYPNGKCFHGRIPPHINRDVPTLHNVPPVVLTQPDSQAAAAAALRASTLRLLQPRILYVQFACPQRCRSYGICVHYQFVMGCKNCPDGLVCEVCRAAVAAAAAADAAGSGDGGGNGMTRSRSKGNNSGGRIERGIPSQRSCPLHQDASRARPISSRAEDFLASAAQREVARQVLTRARGPALGRVDNMWSGGVVAPQERLHVYEEGEEQHSSSSTRPNLALHSNDDTTWRMGELLHHHNQATAHSHSPFLSAAGEYMSDRSASASASAPRFSSVSVLPSIRELLMPPQPCPSDITRQNQTWGIR